MAFRTKKGISRISALCYYGFSSVVLFILFCVLLSVLMTIVKEYNRAKGFISTRCQLSNEDEVIDMGEQICTHCGRGWSCKQSSFPCVQVRVVYKDIDSNRREGMVYYTVNLLHSKKYGHCSRAICHADEKQNEEEITAWVNNWYLFPEGGVFFRPCYYNPANFNEVLSNIEYSSNDVFHALFWPIFGITGILGALIVFAYIFRCGDDPTRSYTSRRRRHAAGTGSRVDQSVSYNVQNNLVVIDGNGRRYYPEQLSSNITPLSPRNLSQPSGIDNPVRDEPNFNNCDDQAGPLPTKSQEELENSCRTLDKV